MSTQSRTPHRWPQIGRYTTPATGARARWPWGITVAAIGASALLAGCGGGTDEEDAAAAGKSTQPVRCEWTAERCA